MARPKGTLNSKTLEAIGILREKNCEPLGLLADIALGNEIRCGVTTIAGYAEVEIRPTLDQRKDAAKELCQYIYPKRKAIEHTGKDGAEIEHRDITKTDAEILAQYLSNNKKGNA